MIFVRFALIAGGAALLDQLSKLAVRETVGARGIIHVIPGLLTIQPTKNRGFAFRTFEHVASPWRNAILVVLPILVLGVLLVALRRRAVISKQALAALALVSGGALGNLIDRVREGYVLDFIRIGGRHMPTMNLADLLTLGGLIWFAAEARLRTIKSD